MEKTSYSFFLAALAAVLAFSMTACNYEQNTEDTSGENPYQKTVTVSRQQVWTHNSYATKISEAFLRYNDSKYMGVWVLTKPELGYFKEINLDQIQNGLCSFEISSLDLNDDELFDWESDDPFSLKTQLFSATVQDKDNNIKIIPLWNDVTIEPAGVKCSRMYIYTYPTDAVDAEADGTLDREGVSGTGSTITGEDIIYVYVNKDCRITGKYNENYIPGRYYFSTEGDLDMQLKKGWNLVSQREAYGTNFNGHAKLGISINNPIKNPENLKWIFIER